MMFGIVKIVYYRSMSSMCLSKGRHCTFNHFSGSKPSSKARPWAVLEIHCGAITIIWLLKSLPPTLMVFTHRCKREKVQLILGSQVNNVSHLNPEHWQWTSGLARDMQFDFRLTVSCLLSHKLWSRDWQHGFLESLCRHLPPLLSPTGQPPLSSQCLTLAKACSE